jgi:glycosyltransferase involved in cell wall biosynthesis
MKKKTIFWFYPHLKFWMGGTVHLYEQLKTLIQKYNFDIYLIVNTGDEKIIKKFKEAKIKVFNQKTLCTNDILYWILFPIFLLKNLTYSYFVLKKFKNKKNAIIFANLFPSNLIAYLISLLFKLDYYFYCYEPFPFFHDKEYINKQSFFRQVILKILSFLYGWLDKYAVKKAGKVFTFNVTKKHSIKKVYGVNSVTTYLGIDTNFFRKIKDKDNFLFKKYKSNILIYHSTDYTPTKNTDLAIKIFRLVNEKYPNTRLLISSTQPNNPGRIVYTNMVKKLKLDEKVVFLDLIPRDHLLYYYSASVCYLFTATLDIHSTSLPNLEAMACETPVIRPKLKYKEDHEFNDGEAGFLVNINDYHQVADKIICLIKNPILKEKMGKKGREIILNRFTWDKVVDKIVENIYV